VYQLDDLILESNTKHAEGVYGTIIYGRLKATGQPIVLKQYKQTLEPPHTFHYQLKEILLLQHLNQYPATKIVKLYGIYIDRTRSTLSLVLERLDTTIKNAVIDYQSVVYQILQAVYAIHSLGVFHSDIKPDNIMLVGDQIRLVDLGLSEFVGIGPNLAQMTSYSGTPLYAAPDLVGIANYVEHNRKTYATDMYSIGATMIELILRRSSRYTIGRRITDDLDMAFDVTQMLSTAITPLGVDLLIKIMNPNVHQRWCCQQAIKHPYFKSLNRSNSSGTTTLSMLGGSYITDVRLKTEIVKYTPEELSQRTMELCYMEEIHHNYMNDLIPSVTVRRVDLYQQHMIWILDKWNSFNNIFTGFDTIINSQLMIKQIIDQQDTDDIQAIVMLVHSIYDSISRPIPVAYFLYSVLSTSKYSVAKLHQLMVDQLMIKTNVTYNFIPIWSHIMYTALKLSNDLVKLQVDNLFTELISLIGKWVLFFFIQTTPYPYTLTTWELVKFCTMYSLYPMLEVSMIELNQEPIIDWLTISPQHCQGLFVYYQTQLEIMHTQPKQSMVLNSLWGDAVPP
jgi:serine/threonine protein kinase